MTKKIDPLEERPSKFELDVYDVFAELETLLLSKHKDYGPRNISDSPGGPVNGLRVRMHDKLARINNLVDSRKIHNTNLLRIRLKIWQTMQSLDCSY